MKNADRLVLQLCVSRQRINNTAAAAVNKNRSTKKITGTTCNMVHNMQHVLVFQYISLGIMKILKHV